MFGFTIVKKSKLDEAVAAVDRLVREHKTLGEQKDGAYNRVQQLERENATAVQTVEEYARRIEHLEKQGQDTWNKWREAVNDKAAAQELMMLAHCAREPFSADRVASTFVNADDKDWFKVILQLVHGHRERALARSADTPEQRIAGMMALDDLKRDLLTRVKMANAERAG